MDSQAQQALREAAGLPSSAARNAAGGPPRDHLEAPGALWDGQVDASSHAADLDNGSAARVSSMPEPLIHGARADKEPIVDGTIPRDRAPQKYTSMGPPLTRLSVSPPENIIEWRTKLYNVSQHPLAMTKSQWDDLWVWVDNVWTPRRVPYTKKDGIVHYEWRCRYHKKAPLPSQSTGKRKREIRKGYGCPARMTANLSPDSGMIQIEGFESHNHGLEELDATKICSGVRKWTSMHVQMGLQPKEIEALVNGGGGGSGGDDDANEGTTRAALDTAGGKLLGEKTIRNIARRWRWPAAKFNMRQEELFGELHFRHNTFPFAIQEPQAFHRDVCEVSGAAQTADDLHRMLDERKEQRLRDLDQRFDATAAELTKDPARVGHQHWEHVLQLFRDRSYDALIRYFATYVEDANPASIPTAQTQPP